MDEERLYEYAKQIRLICLIALSLLVLVVLTFALLSGSEDYGGGISGILKNAPNAIPWFGLLIGVVLAWRNTILGAFILLVLSLYFTYWFNFSGQNFFLITFVMCLLLVLLSLGLLYAGILLKRQKEGL
jgi:hypothetical protein